MSDSELISSYDSDSEMMDNQRRRQLFGQITELQSAVTDMKSAFTTAIQQLGTFEHEEKDLSEKIESNKIETDNQVAEVLKLMLSMRSEFVALKNQVQTSNEIQQNLQQQIQNLAWERDLLIEELHKSGSISEQIRYHLQNCHHFVSRAASGTHSNDSGVAMLNDKAPLQSPFQTASLVISSDQDNESFCEPSLVLVSPLLRDYLVGLNEVKASGLIHSYDSESSLINAANKSLTLSSSLGKQCGLELDQSENNTDDDEDDTAVTAKEMYKIDANDEETSIISSIPLNFEETCIENQRKLIVASILETERSYCKILLTLQEIFAEPLKRNGIISSKDSNTLFPNEVYQIYEMHSTLLLDLEETTDGNIGWIFDKFTDPIESNVLRLYTSYVDDFPEVLKIFHKLCRHKNKKFTNFLKSCLNQPECGGLDLGVFLVAPVQRVPCYILFLKKLLRVCEENNLDRLHLQSALKRLKDFLERLNDTMEHSFQLLASQINPEKDRLHSVSGCPKPTQVRNKLAPHSVMTASNDVPLAWQESQKWKYKELEESSCSDANGSGIRSNSGRCYRYPWRARTDSQDGSKCGYPMSYLEVASTEGQHGFTSHSGRCKLKLRSCSVGAPAHSCNVAKANMKHGPMKVDEMPPQKGCHMMGASKGVQGEETDGEWNAMGTEHFQCTSPSLCFPRNAGKNRSCCEMDADGESKDDYKDETKLARTIASTSKLDVKCKQTEECASSEPNLADPSTKEALAESQCQHPNHCCCNLEKGASLACIIPACGDISSDELDENHTYKSERPLAKSHSSFAVHHHHHHACSLSENMAPSHLNNAPINATVISGPSKIAHSTSSPTLKEKKKISIRTSLKNLLLFKKRSSSSHRHRSSHAFGNCSDCQNLSVNTASTKSDY